MNRIELHSFVCESQSNICQIAAMKDHNMVYSDTWNGYTTMDTVHIASATKSVVSLLIGIVIDQGLLKSTEQKVLEFFPEYQIKRGEKTIEKVTIKHLLTMTAPYKYRSEPWTKVCTSEDWTKTVLDLLGGRAGLTGEFKYSTLGVQILSAIIARTSGMPTIEFANQYLFEPLGIARRTSYMVKNKEEHIQFVTSKMPKERVWFCASDGMAAAGFGLCLSAEEMVQIGQLCLDNGEYHGKQVVSSQWIANITTPFIQCGERFGHMAYGYLWWIIDEKKHIYAAIGDSGNVIYINPKNELVITVTSSFKPAVFDRVEFIQKYIEPLLEN